MRVFSQKFKMQPYGNKILQSYILKNDPLRNKIFIFVLTYMVYVLYHASRKPITVVKPILHGNCKDKDGSLNMNLCPWRPFDRTDGFILIGRLEYFYLLSYAAGLIVCGYIAERMNLRYFLAIGMILSGLSTALFGLAKYWDIHSYSYFIAVQVFAGVAQSSGWPAVMTIMNNWWISKRRGLVLGFWNSHGSIGNVLGSIIAGAYVRKSWGDSFVIPGLLLSTFSIVVYLTVVERPETRTNPKEFINDKEQVSKESASKNPVTIMNALSLPNVKEYSVQVFFTKLVYSTFLYWLPHFIHDTSDKSVDAKSAALFSTLFDYGGIIGGIIGGYFSDTSANSSTENTIRRRSFICCLLVMTSVPTIILYYVSASAGRSIALLFLFMCGMFITGPCSLVMTAITADLGQQVEFQGNSKAMATITALIDASGSLGAAFGPFLTGYLVYHGWYSVFTMLALSNIIASFISYRIVKGMGAQAQRDAYVV